MHKILIAGLVMVLVGLAWGLNLYLNRGNYEAAEFWRISSENNSAVIDHSGWQQVLDEYVISDDPSGINLVDYESLVDESEVLKQYIESLLALDPRNYNRAEQFAYWVNLYNALTINLVVDNYPVKSITKISKTGLSFGPWDDEVALIAGQGITLNDIEHRILRAFWHEHRIHFAVNCASIGCPNLQNVAFNADNTESLLQTAAESYLQHPRGLRSEGNSLVLSSIFDWYGSDFGDNEQEVLATLAQYLSDKKRISVGIKGQHISYDYDWNLNESTE